MKLKTGDPIFVVTVENTPMLYGIVDRIDQDVVHFHDRYAPADLHTVQVNEITWLGRRDIAEIYPPPVGVYA